MAGRSAAPRATASSAESGRSAPAEHLREAFVEVAVGDRLARDQERLPDRLLTLRRQEHRVGDVVDVDGVADALAPVDQRHESRTGAA